MRRILNFATLVLAAGFVSLAGCGGGGGGGDGETPPQASLFFFDGDNVFALPPGSESVPTRIGTGVLGASITTIGEGRYDPARLEISDLRLSRIVFASSGKIYAAGNDLLPRQVSAENAATTVCSIEEQPDYASPDNAAYLYRLPGADNLCGTGDDAWRAVRLGMTSLAAPVDVPADGILEAVNDRSTGAIAWWIVTDNLAIKRCDAGFGTCVPVGSYAGSAVSLGTFVRSDNVLLAIDNAAFVLNAAAATLSGPFYAFLGAPSRGTPTETDDPYIFLADRGRLVRISSGGQSLVLADNNATISEIRATPGKLVYVADNTTRRFLYAVPREGGTSLELDSGNAAYKSIRIAGISGSHVYYTTIDNSVPSDIMFEARHILDDGTWKVTNTDASWAGTTYAPLLAPGRPNTGLTLDRLVLVDYDPVLGLDNATLTSYDAATNADRIVLGTLSPDAGEVLVAFVAGPWIAPEVLGMIYSGNLLNGFSWDVVAMDTDRAGSLVRIRRPRTNEFPIGFVGIMTP